MKLGLPVIQGMIDRRVLVNFRCDPVALSKLLPEPFRPKTIHGFGMAGVCLIRLSEVRPRHLPRAIGLSSENAAHRIAVEWTQADGSVAQGVYIPRRDSSSRLNQLAGGRLFPGVHHHASFDVDDQTDERIHIAYKSDDGTTSVRLDAKAASALPANSIFRSVEEASEFFRGGSIGYSFRSKDQPPDGMELRTDSWHVTPLDVTSVESSFFANASLFPPGTAQFDNALLMRQIPHEWHATPAPGG